MSGRRFLDRRDAGRALGERLCQHPPPATGRRVVLALPRGGVPVACEVAAALDAELDVFVVRKLGVPGHPELAMGAVATGGLVVRNERVLSELDIPDAVLAAVVQHEQAELRRREAAYRRGRAAPSVGGRPVVLVDDGVATGSTMRAAVRTVQAARPETVTVAVPTAPPEVAAALEQEVDVLVCLQTPVPFWSVGSAYRDFTQVTDEEVRQLLSREPGADDEG